MRHHVLVVDSDGRSRKRVREFIHQFKGHLRAKDLIDEVDVVPAADLGVHRQGMAVKILPGGACYRDVRPEDIGRIIDEGLVAGKPVSGLEPARRLPQTRIVLRNCGVVDPEDIKDYIGRGGYLALARVLEAGDPEAVIAELKTSGLRGRGGAGFPTWRKWSFARGVKADRKYIICNADEGDPGAYMDRSVLEGDPHSVIEGMVIGAFVVGASRGYFYIRAEYPLAIERVERAIKRARANGLLGSNILGSGFSFDIEVRLGAGAFVCGEETALIASIEGRRGYPRPRPPYPSVQGLFGRPTVINNVETLANIPAILHHGGAWFAKIGLGPSTGTKVFALTGKVRHSGLVEVPMGTPIRRIVEDLGGGPAGDKPVKAVQTGGPSGGVIPASELDVPVAFETLQDLGSIMGSGGMIVMDAGDCMVDITKFYFRFCVDESCGKCAPCRIGGVQMLRLLEKISEGGGTEEDLAAARRIAQAMQKASLCGLGQTAPNPVLSALRFFEEEFTAHVKDKRCPAGKCGKLFSYVIEDRYCKRCGVCMRNCPVEAISGDREKGYVIDQERCIRCGRCFDVCKFDAVTRN